MEEEKRNGVIISIVVSVLVLCVIGGFMLIIPPYGVWQKGLSGKALLREAEYSKQVLIEQAKADLESASLWAKAEVERAKGVAESTEIISGQLQENEAYLQYLAIRAQEKMANSPNHSTIYIPSGYNGIPVIKSLSE